MDEVDFEFVYTITAIEVLWDHWDPHVWSHWLGVEMVQQVVRVTVAVPAHHHQGDEGGQEDGGQHPNGHDHHRLHGDPGSQHGCGRQLQSVRQETNQRRLICLISTTVASSSVRGGRRRVAAVRLIGWQSNKTSGTIKGDFFHFPLQWSTRGVDHKYQCVGFTDVTPAAWRKSWPLPEKLNRQKALSFLLFLLVLLLLLPASCNTEL